MKRMMGRHSGLLLAAVGGLASTLNQVALSPNRQIAQSLPQSVGAGQTSNFEVACPLPCRVHNEDSAAATYRV